jgi:hypothetical protein
VRARSRERCVAGAVAAVASLAVHVLLVNSLLIAETGRRVHLVQQEGLGANAISSEEEAVATLILIEDPGAGAPQDEPLELAASHGKVLQNLRLTIVSPEPALDLSLDAEDTAAESKEATPEDGSGDRQARAELFGRYLGQIQARVVSTWLRPRTPIGAESFACRVQIQQDVARKVQEVVLQECNGSPRWQVSLVDAIERASPLPAPPDPKVFAQSLQLTFASRPYDPNSSDDGFESVTLTVKVADADRLSAFDAPAPVAPESSVTDADTQTPL